MVASKAQILAPVCRMGVNRVDLPLPLFVVAPCKGYGLCALAIVVGSPSARCSRCPGSTAHSKGWVLVGTVRFADRNELAALKDAPARDPERRRRVGDRHARGKAIYVVSTAVVDTVIAPAETRPWLPRGPLVAAQPPAIDAKRQKLVGTW